MRRLRTRVLSVFFVALLIFSGVASFLPSLTPTAAASGETYTWDGTANIKVTGGQLTAKSDERGDPAPNEFFNVPTNILPGQPVTLHTTLYFYPNKKTKVNGIDTTLIGCQAAMTLVLTDNNHGTITAAVPPKPTGTSIGSANPYCTQDEINGLNLNNTPITISGQRPGSAETEDQKKVDIFVNSPQPFGSSEPSLVGILKDSTGKVIKTDTSNVVDEGPDQLPVPQRDADYPFHYSLDPGNYTFCTDKILTSCWSFTKVKYQTITQTLGDKPSDRGIHVEIYIPDYLPVNQEKIYGPAEVQLFDAQDNLIKDVTAPENDLKPLDKNNDTSYRDVTVGLFADFWDINPGTYKVCLPAIDKCETVTKKAGESAKVVFQLTNAEGTALSAQPRKPDCYLSNDPLSWAICPLFNAISRSSNWIFTNFLVPFLVTEPVGLSSSDPSFQVWSNFRIYGDIILVLAVLVLIIGQAATGGLTETYNLKKLLPRILLVAILINLSVYIVAFLVDITNVAGKALSDLMTAPIKNANGWSFTPNAVQGIGVFAVGLIGFLFVGGSVIGTLTALFFSGTTGSAAFVKVGLYAAMFVVIPLILGILAVFITLIIRKGLILFLVMIAPVAFALYCLPNTEKYFKKWWDLLLEALLVYPIIVAIFAIADILAVTTLTANHLSSTQLTPRGAAQSLTLNLGQILAFLFALLMQFLPLFAIPWSFRLAGGTLSKAQDALTAGAAKISEKTKSRGEAAKEEFRGQRMQGQQKAYAAINKFGDQHRWAKHIPLVGTNRLGKIAGGYNIDAAMSAETARVDKVLRDQIKTGDDTEIRALTVDKRTSKSRTHDGQRQFMTAGGRWVSEADVDRAYGRWGGNHFAQQTALAYEMQKSIEQGQIDSVVRSYPALSNAWGMSEDQANAAWIGAGFANQDSNLEYRYTALNNGKMELNGRNMMIDVDEKRGGYKMAQQSAEAWMSMQQEYKKAQQTMANASASAAERQAATDTLQRGSRIARTMTMQMPDGSFRVNTAGASGRISQEMENFASLAHPSASVAKPSTYGPGQEGQHEANIYTRNR